MVSDVKANRRLKKVAVEDGIILDRSRTSPQQRAGPVTVLKRAVVHDRSRHARLIFGWKQRLRALDASVGILPTPVLRRLNGQTSAPGVDLSLIDIPAE